jgi:hypothetical protein
MSPAVERELDDVREAAEYAASHSSGAEFTIRGYVRHEGRWYVEAFERDNPDPLVMDGQRLIEIVREAQAGSEAPGFLSLAWWRTRFHEDA